MKYLILIILLTGCFTEKKAKQQFSKINITYPEIPISYCADKFGGKDTVIVGDTLIRTDTIYEQTEGRSDTVLRNDTVIITRTLPSTVITKTIVRTDTVRTENKAAIALCELNNRKMTDLLVKQTSMTDNWKKKAKTRFYVMWALILVIVGWIASRIYGMFKL